MLRIAFAGTPEFALPALTALAAAPHALVGVLTQPDRPAGRGRALRASPVKQLAQQLGLPVAQPLRLRTDEEREPLRAWAPDLLVVVAYGLILPPAVLALPRLGCLNIHASLLPRWRGAAPIQRAVLAGDRESGVSIMQLDEGLDTGPILAQHTVPIGADMSSSELHDVLAQAGAPLLLEVIAALAAGHAQARAQPAEGVTHAAKLKSSDALIDWQHPAAAIARQVRGCNAWPIARTSLHGEPLLIWRARDLAPGSRETAAPGTVLGLMEGQLLIACGEGVLAVGELQRAGRRSLGATDFAHGQSLAGLRLG
jgi:methionyl-tRNA formyltransferase